MLGRHELRKRTAPDVEKRGSADSFPPPQPGSQEPPGSQPEAVRTFGPLLIAALAVVCVFMALVRHLALPVPTGAQGSGVVEASSILTTRHAAEGTSPRPQVAITAKGPAQASEAIYRRMRDRRAKALTKAGGISGINPFDQTHGVYIWDWFTPGWNCPDRERIGPVGDGGKWTCGLDALRHNPADGTRCLMYSFGVRDDSRFEVEVINRAGCEVHAFDPTVGGLPPDAATESRMHYHKQAIGPRSGHSDDFLVVESLTDTMARLGHKWIDILKVDVEASEWSVFEALIATGRLPFSQLLIELHYADPASAFTFFDGLERHDFRIFARETNHQPCVSGRLPVAVEFSLLRSPLAQWPPPAPLLAGPFAAPRQMSAALWLLSHEGRLPELRRTLQGLAVGFFLQYNLRGRYPVFLYAPEGDLRRLEDECGPIASAAGFEIKYLPARVARADWPSWELSGGGCGGGGGPSYWAAEFEVRTALADSHDWLLRVGDDARLLKPVAYDVFAMMAEVGKSYGVLAGARPTDEFCPPSKCFSELSQAAQRYASARGLTPRSTKLGRPSRGPSLPVKQPSAGPMLPLLLNDQFEVSRGSLWRRGSRYAELHEELGRARGARLAPFGDAPLQTLHVALAVQEEQVHVFLDVGVEGRGGRGRKLAMGLPPPLPRSPYAPGGVLHADFGAANGTHCIGGRNCTNGTAGEYPRQKAAIYVLADKSRLDRLIEMLSSVERHFNNRFNYPVVVFEEGLALAQKARLSAATRATLIFQPVDFKLPPFLSADEVPQQTGCLPERGLGYRHMCRFQAGEVNQRLSDLGYEWHWRMDDDSLLTSEVPYDVFGKMAAEDKLYGYVSTVRDDDACITGLWEMAREYAQRLGGSAKHTFFDEWPRGAVFYNNLEISHASVWTSAEYRAYFDYIDQAGGIYKRRWGDAPIKSIGVSLFVPLEKVHRFADLGYRHAPFIDQEPAGGGGGAKHRQVPPLCALAWKPERPVRSVIGRHHVEAGPDPELQQLLDPKVGAGPSAWLGADVATSIGLGMDEVAGEAREFVWLFGDTLVGSLARPGDGGPEALQRVRRDAASGGHLVRNSLGVVSVDRHTRRPTSPMRFWWRPRAEAGSGDRPALALHLPGAGREPAEFMWPLAGLNYCQAGSQGCQLLLLAARCVPLRPEVAGLLRADAFSVRGSLALAVRNLRDPPGSWTYEMEHVPVPTFEGLVLWHAGITRADEQGLPDDHGSWAYLLGSMGGWTKQVLARLPIADLAKLDFTGMQVWSARAPGSAPHWHLQSSLPRGDAFAQCLVPIGDVAESTQEAGLWYEPTLQLWYIPFIERRQLILRTAARLTGPWSSHVVYEVPSRWHPDDDYLAYAVKSHPELAVEGEIVLTYNVNMLNNPFMGKLFEVGEAVTYVPQFLRLRISTADAGGRR